MWRELQMRRELKIGLAAACVLSLGAALAFGPFVRAKAKRQADKRGLVAEIGAVRPGFGRVWLKELTVRVPELPAVEVKLDAVEVGVGPLLGVRHVVAHGGTVVVRGGARELEEQLRAWRARDRDSERSPKSSVKYRAEGLTLVWHGGDGSDSAQHAWGARYERDAEGGERFGADRARVAWRGVELELEQATVGLRRIDGRRVIERIAADAMVASLELGQLTRGAPPPRAPEKGTVPVSARHGAPPGAAALTERLNRFVPLDPERGVRLRDRVRMAARLFADSLPEQGELDISGLRLRVRRGKEGLGIGPARLRVTRSAENLAITLLPGTGVEMETPVELALDLPLGAGPIQLAIDGGPVSLAALGVQNGDLGLQQVERARLELSGKALLSADGRTLAWEGGAKLRDVSVEQSWLAAGRVSGVALAGRGKGEAALDGSRLDLHDVELELGQVRTELRGLVERGADWTRADLSGGIPLASCQAMLDSMPHGLTPLLGGMKMSGTFSLAGKLEFDTRQLDRMVTTWTAANQCRITATSAEISPRRFLEPWVRQVKDGAGRAVQIQSGPGTAGWSPRYAASRHMETAVLICEDGAFFRHDGFDREAIRNSIRENVKMGKFVRGASTISMQLAKNLYLPREKTVSRKLQEAVLTLLLEQELSKDQILELYLNVIEFGPGIYGIGPAAQHYFNSSASQLSLGQSLYLASILPSPSRQYFGAGGQVTPGWMGYLRKLMQIAVKIRRLSPEELEDALREQVTFGVAHSPLLAEEGGLAAATSEDEAVFAPSSPDGLDGY
jgi:hypothetical protein